MKHTHSPERKLNRNKLFSLERLSTKDLFFVLYDAMAVMAAYFFALWFRFDCQFSEITEIYLTAWWKFAPAYALISVAVLRFFHLYQSIWKYASYIEVKQILRASVILSVIHSVLITLVFYRMPISYYVIGAMIQVVLITAVRFGYRFVSLEWSKNEKLSRTAVASRVMLIGAGQAGQMILRDVNRPDGSGNRKVCCIIDDNSNKWGRYIDGVPVVGGRQHIASQVKKYQIEQIFLAIPSASNESKREFVCNCNPHQDSLDNQAFNKIGANSVTYSNTNGGFVIIIVQLWK
jgi:FlaA1/EpsC-like NDP-sugar epimerase